MIGNGGALRRPQARTGKRTEPNLEGWRVWYGFNEVIDGRVNGNLNLTRAMGDFEYKDKKMKPEEMIITAAPDLNVYVDILFRK
jgi:hypothetical protein